MSLKEITRDIFLSGQSSSEYIGLEGQFQSSIGIDPDMPKTDTAIRPSGLLRPTSMALFSASEITGVPLWMTSNPKDSNCYVYANDGKVHVVDSALTMGTALNSGNALSASSANGATYYDNKIILIKNTDVAVYQLWNTTLVQDYWTNTLSLTALTDTTYPSINGVEMPNHVAHRHTDDKCYFADVADNKGVLHYIKTTKTTNEGDTDDGSTYNALDFDYGWYITAIESFDNYLLIALIEGTNTTVNQKPAKLALWDTFSDTFEDVTPDNFNYPLITALKNVNGQIYIFAGNATGGCHISKFMGVNMVQPITYLPDAYPPLHGAVDHLLSRVSFGSKTTIPVSAGVVYSIGSLYPSFAPSTGVHGILKSSSAGANPYVTCLRYFAQSPEKPQPIIGWDDDSNKGLDKISTTYGTSYFMDAVQRIGRPFRINRVVVPLSQALAANMTLTVKAIFDGVTGSAVTLATINNTNYPGERNINIKSQTARGENDFYLQFEWTGTALMVAELPIKVFIEIEDD